MSPSLAGEALLLGLRCFESESVGISTRTVQILDYYPFSMSKGVPERANAMGQAGFVSIHRCKS